MAVMLFSFEKSGSRVIGGSFVGGCGSGDECVGRLELLPSAAPGVGEQPAVVWRDARVDGERGVSSLREDRGRQSAGALLIGGDEHAVV